MFATVKMGKLFYSSTIVYVCKILPCMFKNIFVKKKANKRNVIMNKCKIEKLSIYIHTRLYSF